MQKTRTGKLRIYLKWFGWVILMQLVLINISASLYAYRLTHFYPAPANPPEARNIFQKTWRLFTGPKTYKNTEEKEPDFPFRTVRLSVSGNTGIDAWYGPVDSALGCVIFFHGITANKSYLRKEAAMFRSWGYNVMLIDFRAHGRSDGNNSSFGVSETEEVQKAFDWAKKEGNRTILLYGVSLGAGVCLKAVSDGLVEPAGIVADMPFGRLQDHLEARAKSLGFPSQPFATLVTLWIGIKRGYNGFGHDVGSYAKKVKCPVVLGWGEKDLIVTRREAEYVLDKLGSAHKKMVIYPNAGHESYLQQDPEIWKREMQAFCKKISG
ncbi:MAG TPA: alpha/beta hydrolase [Flavisolibacter sp.]|nr:alpha/beta hydrolase [Flavisolibacter sp.]